VTRAGASNQPALCTVLGIALARIEILEGRASEDKRRMIDAVRCALSEALKAPAADPLVRLIEYPASEFTLPYPDRHSDRYTLVEITMFVGRSVETKRRLYRAVVDGLAALDVPEGDITVVLYEPSMHNWGVEGGHPASEVDVGFKVDI
jgi:phenylpyruvate tautomerase PptA (4-oxalocrotonate tautomerase family)